MPGTPSGPGVSPSLARGGKFTSRFQIPFFMPGHAARREGIHKEVQRYNVNPFNVNSGIGWLTVPFETEEFRDADFFGAVGSLTTRLSFSKAGLYEVRYNLQASRVSGGLMVLETRLKFTSGSNAGAVRGSQVALWGNDTLIHLGCSATARYNGVENDYVEVQTQRVSGTGRFDTVTNVSTLYAKLLSYPGEQAIGGRWYADKDGAIERITITRGVKGTSGTTYVDVLRNGTTMIGSTKLPVASTDDVKHFDVQHFSSLSTKFYAGDLLTVDLTTEESPYPRDLLVVLSCVAQ